MIKFHIPGADVLPLAVVGFIMFIGIFVTNSK